MPGTGAADDRAEVAGVLLALGEVMGELHSKGLALQEAIAALAAGEDCPRTVLRDLQALDLATQIHADLARFLPTLAEQVRDVTADRTALGATLTLADLKARLADGAEREVATGHGEIHLF